MTRLTPFHLAIPVHDLAAARAFYGGLFGCPEGRSAEHWVDFDLFGHQLVCHRVDGLQPPVAGENPVDGHDVPVPHFGVVLELDAWHALAERLRASGGNRLPVGTRRSHSGCTWIVCRVTLSPTKASIASPAWTASRSCTQRSRDSAMSTRWAT